VSASPSWRAAFSESTSSTCREASEASKSRVRKTWRFPAEPAG
jgi:hypothetical protein